MVVLGKLKTETGHYCTEVLEPGGLGPKFDEWVTFSTSHVDNITGLVFAEVGFKSQIEETLAAFGQLLALEVPRNTCVVFAKFWLFLLCSKGTSSRGSKTLIADPGYEASLRQCYEESFQVA